MENEMPLPQSNQNFAKVVKTWQVEMLIGKLMLIVETMGLEEKQEKSAKSLMKQEIWKEFNDGIYISQEMEEKNRAANLKVGVSNITQ